MDGRNERSGLQKPQSNRNPLKETETFGLPIETYQKRHEILTKQIQRLTWTNTEKLLKHLLKAGVICSSIIMVLIMPQ